MAESDEEYVLHVNFYYDQKTHKLTKILTSEGDELDLSQAARDDLANAVLQPKQTIKEESGKQKKPRKRTKAKTDQKGLEQLKSDIEEDMKKDLNKAGVDFLRKALGSHQDFHRLLEDDNVNLLAHGKWNIPPKCWPQNTTTFIDPNNGSMPKEGPGPRVKIKPKKELLVAMYKTFLELYKQYQDDSLHPVQNPPLVCEPEDTTTAYSGEELDGSSINFDKPDISYPASLTVSSSEILQKLENLMLNSTDHPGLQEQIRNIIDLVREQLENTSLINDVWILVNSIGGASAKQENWNDFSSKCQKLLGDYWFQSIPVEDQFTGSTIPKQRKTLVGMDSTVTAGNNLNISLRTVDSDTNEMLESILCDALMPVMEPVTLKKPQTSAGDGEAGSFLLSDGKDNVDGNDYVALQSCAADFDFLGADMTREGDIAASNLGKYNISDIFDGSNDACNLPDDLKDVWNLLVEDSAADYFEGLV